MLNRVRLPRIGRVFSEPYVGVRRDFFPSFILFFSLRKARAVGDILANPRDEGPHECSNTETCGFERSRFAGGLFFHLVLEWGMHIT